MGFLTENFTVGRVWIETVLLDTRDSMLGFWGFFFFLGGRHKFPLMHSGGKCCKSRINEMKVGSAVCGQVSLYKVMFENGG